MESVVVAYCASTEGDFERTIPLNYLGQRNRRLGYSNDIHVLFVSGYERLSPGYTRSLRNLGFTVHDVSSLYRDIERDFKGLARFDYQNRFTFLRWPTLASFFGHTPFIHYDGDVVCNEDPAEIARKVAGLTFVLQGCPAFTVVSESSWLDDCVAEIRSFSEDVDGYCARAWAERTGWEITFYTRWAGCYYDPLFVGDQDLISHLIHTGRIQQDPVEQVMLQLEDYVLFENPLFVHLYQRTFPVSYRRDDGVDYFAFYDGPDHVEKKVLLWHFQSYFNFYAAKFVLRKRLMRSLAALFRVRFDHVAVSAGRGAAERGFEDRVQSRLNRLFRHTDRLAVYRHYFEEDDFGGLLSARAWWQPGVFS